MKYYMGNHIKSQKVNEQIIGDRYLTEYVMSPWKVVSCLHRYIVLVASTILDITAHKYQPWDCIYVRTWTKEPLHGIADN